MISTTRNLSGVRTMYTRYVLTIWSLKQILIKYYVGINKISYFRRIKWVFACEFELQNESLAFVQCAGDPFHVYCPSVTQ